MPFLPAKLKRSFIFAERLPTVLPVWQEAFVTAALPGQQWRFPRRRRRPGRGEVDPTKTPLTVVDAILIRVAALMNREFQPDPTMYRFWQKCWCTAANLKAPGSARSFGDGIYQRGFNFKPDVKKGGGPRWR